jgi:hypothetical protein
MKPIDEFYRSQFTQNATLCKQLPEKIAFVGIFKFFLLQLRSGGSSMTGKL